MMSLTALLQQGQRLLSETKSTERIRLARLDAQVLLCHTLKVDQTHVYTAPEARIPECQQQEFLAHIDKRRRGVPVAHLTGLREFWSLKLEINEHTLIPRPETEHLVEAALAILQQGVIRELVDLGTGSGAIALALASEIPQCHITATDICPNALEVAKSNARHLILDNISLQQGSWYEPLQGKVFDMIVSNPPYIADDHACLDDGDVHFEPRQALSSGTDGLDALRIIIQNAPTHLRPGGWIVLEHGYDQGSVVQALLNSNGFDQIKTIKDYAGHDRISQARRLKL